jgi:hypothetical protein
MLEVAFDAKFTIKSRRLLVYGLTDEMIDELTKEEMKTLIAITSKFTSIMNKANVLKVPFKDVTPNMKPVARSRFKKKLIELGIMNEYNGKLWISPLILEPLEDKNIINFKHHVQQAWIYLFHDKDKRFDGIDDFIKDIFK